MVKYTFSVTSFLPCEVVGDHSTSNGHLLEGKNELTDPDESYSVIPHQVLKRALHLIFNHTCRVVLYRGPCKRIQSEFGLVFSISVSVILHYIHTSASSVALIFLSNPPGNKCNKIV